MKKKKPYAVWIEAMDGDAAYWSLFDSISEAVESQKHDGCDETEVYQLEPKLLGTYRLETKVVKLRAKK